MTSFTFRAARPDGQIVRGAIDASSPQHALDLIALNGLFGLEVTHAPRAQRRAPNEPAELSQLLRALAALHSAGVPADRAVMTVAELASPAMAQRFADAGTRLADGVTLSEALQQAAAIPPLVAALIRAAEHGGAGALASAMQRAAEDLEQAALARQQLVGALTYPAFLASAGSISVGAIMAFVVPRFATLLATEGRTLPHTTRLLVASGETARLLALPLAIAAIGTVLLLRRALQEPRFATHVHYLLLQLPILGEIRLRFASGRACRALAALLQSGTPIVPALQLAGEAAADLAVQQRLGLVRTDVERGEPLAASLRRYRAFSHTALRLAGFGESSGNLYSFLSQAARLETSSAQQAVHRLVKLAEPVLILVFGAIVALVAAALLQAIYSLRPAG